MRIAKNILLIALCMFVSTFVSTNCANEELATETFGIACGTDITRISIVRDVSLAHTFLSKRLGAENVYLITYVDPELRDDPDSRGETWDSLGTIEGVPPLEVPQFDAKGVNEYVASPEGLKRLIEDIGERSSSGDVVFFDFEGHGDQQSRLKPAENTISFSIDSTAYTELAEWLTAYLPGRRVMIFTTLCHGGGNHQMAFDLPNVSVISGTNHEFGKDCPGPIDVFTLGFYKAFEDNPNATFSEAYWSAVLNDPHNSDDAKISSEVYLEVLFGKGDYSKENITGYSVQEYCEASMSEMYALSEEIDRIEELWKKDKFANPADFLPEQIAAMKNHLIHRELDWLKEIIGSQEWQESKKSYAKGLQELKKVVKERKGKAWPSREDFQDVRRPIEREFYPLVLAREWFNKIESLNLLFKDDRLVEERRKYLDLLEHENRPVFPTE